MKTLVTYRGLPIRARTLRYIRRTRDSVSSLIRRRAYLRSGSRLRQLTVAITFRLKISVCNARGGTRRGLI